MDDRYEPSPLVCTFDDGPRTPLRPILKDAFSSAYSLGLNSEDNSLEGSKNVHFSTPLEIPGNDLVLTTYTPRGILASHKIRRLQQLLCESCDALKTRVSTKREDCKQYWWPREKRTWSSLHDFPPTIFSDDICSDSETESFIFDYHPGFLEASTSAVKNYRDRFLEKLKKSLTIEKMGSDDFTDSECVQLLSNIQPDLSSILSEYAPIDLISISFDYDFCRDAGEVSHSDFLLADQDSDLISITYYSNQFEGPECHSEEEGVNLDTGSLNTLASEEKQNVPFLLKVQDEWDLFENESHFVLEHRRCKESRVSPFNYEVTETHSEPDFSVPRQETINRATFHSLPLETSPMASSERSHFCFF